MKYFKIVFAALIILMLAGCSSGGSGTNVWIDVPINNLTLTDPKPIQIEGHAASPEGINLIEVWINGELIETIPPTSSTETLAVFETTYTPSGPGEYIIQVIALGADGVNSNPDTTRVLIGEEHAAIPVEDLPTDTPTLVPTHTPTATPTPVPGEPSDDSPIINYWADSTEIEAGGCTTLYWEISNVSRVEFGGTDQEFSGHYYDCMCETQTYPLSVTYYDASRETFYVTINVTGTCGPTITDTPTPVPDTVGPNPPTLLKPLNGHSFSCIPDTILRWEAASDPSGISEYRVQVERHPGDNNWQAVSGSVFTGIGGLEKLLNLECGYTYRWRVRAIDGANNMGSWSGWFTFVVPLT